MLYLAFLISAAMHMAARWQPDECNDSSLFRYVLLSPTAIVLEDRVQHLYLMLVKTMGVERTPVTLGAESLVGCLWVNLYQIESRILITLPRRVCLARIVR